MDLVLRLLQQPMLLQLLLSCFFLQPVFIVVVVGFFVFGNFSRAKKMVQRDFCEWICASTTWWHGPRGLTSLNCKWDEKMFMQKREKHTKFRESSTDLQMSQSKEKQRQAAFHVETFFIRRWKNARNEDNLARLALNKKPTLIGFNLDEMCEEKKRAMENCSRFFYWEMITEIWIMIFTLMIHHQSIIRTNCWRLIAGLGAVYCFNEHFSWSRHADVDFEDDDFRKIFNRPINASRVKPFGINCLDASLSVACQNDPCCANQLSRLHRNFVGFSNLRKVSL